MAKVYIEREDALKGLEDSDIGFCDDEPIQTRNRALKIIQNIPAADVVEVVRCKNCLRWKRDAYGGVCDRYGVRLDGDWFCAGGEKREVQDDN